MVSTSQISRSSLELGDLFFYGVLDPLKWCPPVLYNDIFIFFVLLNFNKEIIYLLRISPKTKNMLANIYRLSSFSFLIECVNTEHVKRTTGTDENSSRSSKTALTERKDSHSIRNETTRDNSAYERPSKGRERSSISVDQMVSGTVKEKTAKREDFLPIVTYEGNEDTKECSAKASTTYTHREVNVIVHKSSSSSSSTCSSVRSIDQRRHASLCSYGTLRHQVSSHHQTSQGQIRLGECDSTSNKDSFFKQNANDDCTHTDQTTIVKCEETVELQVLKVPRETIGEQQINESKQNGTNLGGSLGAMFDF